MTDIPIGISLKNSDVVVVSEDYVLAYDPMPLGTVAPAVSILNFIALLIWLVLIVPVLVRYRFRIMMTRHTLQKLMEWLEEKPPADEWAWDRLAGESSLSAMKDPDAKTITEVSQDLEAMPRVLETNLLTDEERELIVRQIEQINTVKEIPTERVSLLEDRS